jgi:IS1 family transposase
MNYLTNVQRTQVIKQICEGSSIRTTVRLTGVAKNSIVKLLREIGAVCAQFHDKTLRNLPCKRIQCDEIWSFCYAKDKNVPQERRGTFGFADLWTWTAIDPDTKLIASWAVGRRDAGTAYEFMNDLAGRLTNRVQLTTDGNRAYLQAVEDAFGATIDYAMLIKLYGGDDQPDTKYSPAECIGTREIKINGNPKPMAISTSHVERHNLAMRMSMRRFARLTNAFSKKLENHVAMLCLYFVYYNLCRIHQTLRVTPAMEAGIADHVWDVKDLVSLLPAIESKKRGSYRKRNHTEYNTANEKRSE